MPLVFPLVGPLGAGDTSGSTVTGSVLPGVDQVDSALNRLVFQFKNKANIKNLLSLLLGPAQDIDDQLQLLSTLPNIDQSVGVQLDVLGALVGEARQGADDATYRLHIKARIATNRSSGTPEDVYFTFGFLLPTCDFYLEEQYPAAFELHVSPGALDPTLIVYLLRFLKAVKPAGVKAFLHWLGAAESSTFTFAGGPGLGLDSGIWSSAEEA